MIAKTIEEIEELRISGKILSDVLRALVAMVAHGISTAELDLVAGRMILEKGGVPSFLNYKPYGAPYPYPSALCVSINDEVVHGIPSETRILKNGDSVSLDIGLSYHGYFTDTAVTVCVGECDPLVKKLITATREALSVAIGATRAGGHIGDIGAAVEIVANKYKFSIVDELGGHAVGKAVHERPFIANVGTKGKGEKIVEGMVLALEPILTTGTHKIMLATDKWTYLTRDHSIAAHFEQTILITKTGVEILTPF